MLRHSLILLGLTWTTIPHANAQAFVYALSEHGRVTVNGSQFYNLPEGFDPGDPLHPQENERWLQSFVQGRDHYHLRRDGRLHRNGRRLFRLPRTGARWERFLVDTTGVVHAISRRGHVSRDDRIAYQLPVIVEQDRIFADLAEHQGEIYALRRDGQIYVGSEQAPRWDLPGIVTSNGSGERFRSLRIDPQTGDLYALRQDGQLYRANANNMPLGSLVIDLPEGGTQRQFRMLCLDETAQWWALREDGVIFNTSSGMNELIDYPGSGRFEHDDFNAMTVVQGEFYAIRWDGCVYANQSTSVQWELPGTRYIDIASSTEVPSTSGVGNFRPSVARYQVRAYRGDTVRVPVFVTDSDDPVSNLTITVLEQPPGSTYDPNTLELTMLANQVGSFRFRVSVSDGRVTRKVTTRIQVKEPAGQARNQKPRFMKVSSVQLFRGRVFSLPVQAFDPNGDPLVYTAESLPSWVTYNAQTNAFEGQVPVVQSNRRPVIFRLLAVDDEGAVARTRIRVRFADAFHVP